MNLGNGLLIPEANVFRDYGTPSFFKLMISGPFTDAMVSGFLNDFYKNGTLVDGDFVTVYQYSQPPYVIRTQNYPWCQSRLQGGIKGRAVLYPKTETMSWIPHEAGGELVSAFAVSQLLTVTLTGNNAANLSFNTGVEILRVGALVTDLGAQVRIPPTNPSVSFVRGSVSAGVTIDLNNPAALYSTLGTIVITDGAVPVTIQATNNVGSIITAYIWYTNIGVSVP